MTITEKHRTEYKLIDQAINELTQVMQKISTLEAAAEEHRREADELHKSEIIHREAVEQLKEQLFQEKAKNESLSIDLEKTITERDRLQTEILDAQARLEKQTALWDAETEKLKEDLQLETAERNKAVKRLRESFSQMQDLMNSVQSLMGPSTSEIQPEEL